MDDLVELVLETLFEFPFDATMESRRLKTGVKTGLFCVLGGGITLFFAAITIQKWIAQDDVTGAFYMTLITAVMLFGVIFGAIKGHKRKWKRE